MLFLVLLCQPTFSDEICIVLKSTENENISCLTSDDVVQGVRAHVESVVSAKVGELD